VRRGGNRIALLSWYSEKFVRAGIGQESMLGASSDQAAGWETFELIDRGGGRVALRSVQNGKFVRAGIGQESMLAASSDQVAAWEIFQIFTLSPQEINSGTPPLHQYRRILPEPRLPCPSGPGNCG